MIYKTNNLNGNSNNSREFPDGMIEHVFERIWLNIILHLKGDYLILDHTDLFTNYNIKLYINDKISHLTESNTIDNGLISLINKQIIKYKNMYDLSSIISEEDNIIKIKSNNLIIKLFIIGSIISLIFGLILTNTIDLNNLISLIDILNSHIYTCTLNHILIS